jgi:hypothetical protein
MIYGGNHVNAEEGGVARTFLLSLHNLNVAKDAYLAGNPVTVSDVVRLKSVAERHLLTGPFSVTLTPEVAPSGDPHDLVSYGYYYWANPNTPSGLPWIYRDGHGNSANEVDWKQVFGLAQAANSLSLAYFFTEDERYATHLAGLLRTFFLDEATRMNPRIEYSDVIPGISPGSYGVPGLGNAISSYKLIDAAGILESSPAWTAEDRTKLQAWAKEFVRWAEVHPKGIRQRDEPSNHGTNYDFVSALLSMYADEKGSAEKHYSHFVLNRMPKHIAPDGSNPLEMVRANNFLYHRYNLSRSMDIGSLGTQIDAVNLFEYETSEGLGLRDSLDYLIPYFVGDREWDQWPGTPFARESPLVYYELLRKAATYYKDPALLEAANRIHRNHVNFVDLTHPEHVVYEDWPLGDADMDGSFSSSDIVRVFQVGKYETTQDATWMDGDWNLDRRFNSLDFVVARQSTVYEASPRGRLAAVAVPEPSCGSLWVISLFTLSVLRLAGRSRGTRFDEFLCKGGSLV